MENPGYNPESSIAIPEGALDCTAVNRYNEVDSSYPPFPPSYSSIANPGFDPDTDVPAKLKAKTGSQISDESTPSEASSVTDLKLYARRWVILAIFSLNTMMNEVIWISLSSVSNIVKEYYHVDSFHINWLATIFSVVYISVVFCIMILNKYGLKATIVGGSLMNAIASVLRLIGYRENGYYYALIGNVIGGFGQSFLIFIPPTLSSVWFGEQERARASAIGMSMNMLGIAVGFLMGSQFIPHGTPEQVKRGMFTTLLTQCVICVVLLFAAAIFIKAEPPTPPTYSQAIAVQRKVTKLTQQRKQSKSSHNSTTVIVNTSPDLPSPDHSSEDSEGQSTGFRKNWRMLLMSRNFHLLSQAYAICFAMMVTCSTLLNQMTVRHYPHGHTKLIGLMGAAATVLGLVSMMLAGMWIDRTRRYKLISCVVFVAGAVTSLTFTLVLKYTDSFAATFACFCVHGFCMYPYLAVGLEYIAEVMYPVKESILSFICLFLSTLYGTAFITVLGVLMKKVGTEITGYIIVTTYCIGFFCVFFVNGELKRYKIDAQKKRERNDTDTSLPTIAE